MTIRRPLLSRFLHATYATSFRAVSAVCAACRFPLACSCPKMQEGADISALAGIDGLYVSCQPMPVFRHPYRAW